MDATTNPLYVYEIEFHLVQDVWSTQDFTREQLLELMKTGLYKNHQVRRVKIDNYLKDGTMFGSLVYDIEAAKTGGGEIWTLL